MSARVEAEPSVLVAAGGTGGHLFPAEALAAALGQRGISVQLITDSRAARHAGAFQAAGIHVVPSATIRGRNPFSLARTCGVLGYGLVSAWFKLRRLNPAVVIGFGGYPTIPPLLAAVARGIPTIVHEQNAVMGRANRLLAPRVRAIATGFPGVLNREPALAAKATLTGNPVRPAVIAAAATPYPALEADGPLQLLVFGGSQGARVFSDVVPEAIARLEPQLQMRLRLVQQARDEDLARVRDAYTKMQVAAEVASFFSDLPARMAASHLVVSRSGASTVAELSAIGRPGILVPLPHALDQDQRANAGVLMEAGGAIRLDQAELTPDRLAVEIAALAAEPARLIGMAQAARSIGATDAAGRLADLVLRVAGRTEAQIPIEPAAALVPFQAETEALLMPILARYSSDQIRRTVVRGSQDSFIQVEVLPLQLTAYIYLDGAEISGKQLDKRFEIYDYADLSELQRAFLDVARRTF